MLKLKNIKRNNGIISAEYDPENSGDLGSVSINTESFEVVERKLSKQDSICPIYLNHAIDGLKKLSKEKNLPEEKMIMWH